MTEIPTNLARSLSRIEVAAARAEKLSARARQAREHTQQTIAAELPEILHALESMSANQVRDNLLLVTRAFYVAPEMASAVLGRILPDSVTGYISSDENSTTLSMRWARLPDDSIGQIIETIGTLMRLTEEIYAAMLQAELTGSIKIAARGRADTFDAFGLGVIHGIKRDDRGWNVFNRQLDADLDNALCVMRETLKQAETKEPS